MKKLLKSGVIFLLSIVLFLPCAQAQERTRGQLRERYEAYFGRYFQEKTDADAAKDVNEGSKENSHSDEMQAALAQVNFVRYLAGLGEVSLSSEMNDMAWSAAVLCASNAALSHEPVQSEGVDDALYEKGRQAAAGSNLIMFNWSRSGLLEEAVVLFARDEGEENQYALGHRRWLLYPYMKETGFGMAQDADGRSYIAMYVMDDSAQDTDYDMICYPSGGAFPAEYMSAETAWSISFDPQKYDLIGSTPYLIMIERTSGAEFRFERLNTQEELESGGQYFILSGGRYADGAAYIFRPDLSEYDELMYGYEQNQVWDVRIEGMKYADGTYCEPIEYRVEMVSLTPIEPAAVEIMPRERVMATGESAQLSAQVVPQWADDLSVEWSSSDEWVASVSESGVVHANGKGTCEIIARSINGHEDRITVTVK